MLLFIIGKHWWSTVHNGALALFTAPINRIPGSDCSTIVHLTDARLTGTVLPPFTSVAKEGFLTRTNDLIADDAGIHGVVFKKTVFQRLRMIDY